MNAKTPDAREVILVRGLFTADDSGRSGEFLARSDVQSLWQVEIRTARVRGRVLKRSSLGNFLLNECICLDLHLERAVPVEPGLRFHIVSEFDASLTATGVVRPWD